MSSVLMCWDDAGIEGHSVLRERRSRQRAPMEGPRIGGPHHVFGGKGAQKPLFHLPTVSKTNLRRSLGCVLYFRFCVPTPVT